MSKPARLVLFLTLSSLLCGAFLLARSGSSQERNREPIAEFEPPEFTFATVDESAAGKWLFFRWEDGRVQGIDLATLSAVRYYPKSLAERVGLPEAHLELVVGGVSRRIDLPEENNANDILYTIFDPESLEESGEPDKPEPSINLPNPF